MPNQKSDLVQVSPQERVRRKPGESDADVRRRWTSEQRALDKKISDNRNASEYYRNLSQQTDIGARMGMQMMRAIQGNNYTGSKVIRKSGTGYGSTKN